MATAPLALKKHFARLPDPRLQRRRRHLLLDIITIALCAVICGADTWPQVVAFGYRRKDWLKKFLALPNGIPSHDTFERVFDRLNPVAFQWCFASWTRALAEALGLKHIAIDGKTLRGSARSSAGLRPLQLVSAWATANHLSLGQVAVAKESNEITAIPLLLEMLDVHGALVTIDAMGCQKEIARQIVEGGGDYLLTVKDNQEHLAEDIGRSVLKALDNDLAGVKHSVYVTEESGHGREEKRCYVVLEDLEGIRDREAWRKLKVIGACCCERTSGGKTSKEVRCFIGSKAAGARYYGRALRDHWRIENCLHWQLDVTFGEDASRIQKRHAAENFAVLRRMALGLLKRHSGKGSIATKRFEAALDVDFLEEIINR
jgi:predicted transposase YbfD/YdcC